MQGYAIRLEKLGQAVSEHHGRVRHYIAFTVSPGALLDEELDESRRRRESSFSRIELRAIRRRNLDDPCRYLLLDDQFEDKIAAFGIIPRGELQGLAVQRPPLD
jgi:hypothetical protein